MAAYDTLQPAAVWKLFADIDRIPRMSGREAAVMTMLEQRAQAKGFATKRDKVGNLLIGVPATKGRESAPVVTIQGHVDMVCEKNASSKHDFNKDPIVPREKDGWVVANGTTLGADNAIGVSMMLAAAEDPKVVHGPLEILLTVDEERGLTGAGGLQPGFFTGGTVLNLDSEDDRAITISCAGLRESLLTVKCPRAAAGPKPLTLGVFVKGLRGGHSGLDINKGRGNAVKVLVRALLAAAESLDVRIAMIEGGNKRNAIPREARATVVIPSDQKTAFEVAVKETIARIRAEELSATDEGLEVEIAPARAGDPFTGSDTRRLLHLLAAIPHGIQALSQTVEDLVETSSNLAVVATSGDAVRIGCTSRSSVNASLDMMALQHRALAALAGAEIELVPGVPGWKPDTSSPLLAVVKAQYKKVFGKVPEVRGVHAGLENGVLKEKSPDIDTISFGPNIEGAHSPDERVEVKSVQKMWKLLVAVLAALAVAKKK